MKTTITILLLTCAISAHCQTMEQQAGDLYAHKKYSQALAMSFSLLKNGKTSAFANQMIGRIYVEQKMYDSSISYLQQAIKLDGDNTFISGWSHAYLGLAEARAGHKEKGVAEFKKAIELHLTGNSVLFAEHYLGQVDSTAAVLYRKPKDYGTSEPHWVMIEGAHITYYFQDTAGMAIAVSRYIKQHEEAYVKINETFQARLPKKMTFHVWLDRALAKQILHHDLGFTDPEECSVNASIDQTIGHEMTHALSYWAWGYKPKERTRFINEGIAVAFDQSKNDKNDVARKAIAGKNIHSVLDIWKNENADQLLIYPVGGAFLTYLYNKCTPEQFKSIVKNQTIESVRNTLGKEHFDAMIAEFDKTIGFK